MKRLIVTADDFGFDAQVNAAVVQAFQQGILRFASLMVDFPGAADAVALAKANPGLGVGLHVVLCEDEPEKWGARYFFVPRHRRSIEPKIRAQIEKFLSFGLKPTHADGHINIQAHPVIFPILARLAREYGIPRLRLPAGELGLNRGFGRPLYKGRLVEAAMVATLGRGLRAVCRAPYVTARTLGLLRSGLMDEDYVCWLLGRLPEGTTEIYFHPTTNPATAVSGRPTPGHHTVTELRTLTSPRVRRALEESGAALLGPSDLFFAD